MIFKPCINYDRTLDRVKRTSNNVIIRQMSDDDYKTFSSVAGITINTVVGSDATDATHIFLKCKGVDRYVVSFDGGGNFTRNLPDNFTNFAGNSVSATRLGFQHDLYELNNTKNVSEIEITFTAKSGETIEIYEIMILNLVYEIPANKRFIMPVHSKIDRAAGMHQNTKGFKTRYKRIGAKRWAWKSVYNCLFEADMNYDEFWLMLERNRNLVFAQEPNNTPHRIYPASIMQMAYNADYRSSAKSEGVIMRFEIQEG